MSRRRRDTAISSNSFYRALSHPYDPLFGHEVDESIYRDAGKPETGYVEVDCGFVGEVPVEDADDEVKFELTSMVEIPYTRWGTGEMLVVFLHGVPTNRIQYYPIQKRMARFCETVSFDMLGLGESTMPLRKDLSTWDWINDSVWLERVMQTLYGNRKFIFFSDDWGSGIALHYAAKFPRRLLALGLMDPIIGDSYPVSEIQAIGRLSAVKDEQAFQSMTGAFDQTLVQIFKSMVRDSARLDQFKLRDLKWPYADVDYERSKYRDGEDADSMTLRLNHHAIRVLADRSSRLAPAQLLPFDSIENPRGVNYQNITVPVLLLWGTQDNMMARAQTNRMRYAFSNTSVQINYIPDAGHYAGIDQPDYVAEAILNFIIEKFGKKALEDIFLGFSDKGTRIWKGDENFLIRDLREIYGMNMNNRRS